MSTDNYTAVRRTLATPVAVSRFAALYGTRKGESLKQMARYSRLVKWHEDCFHAEGKVTLVSAPGRTEIIGNHTDHNNGRVMAAAVTLDTVAAVTPRSDLNVTIYSEGFSTLSISLDDISPISDERGQSAALVRGVASRMKALGYAIGGFDAVVTSNVPGGSGLSSSAAYEVLICAIFDALYNGCTVDATKRAQIAQYAENAFFGKPCGLMDQMASSTGGIVAIDFKGEPIVKPLQSPFGAMQCALVVVNTRGAHDDLTEEYSAIRADMRRVAEYFGEDTLRRVRPEQMMQEIGKIRAFAGDRAVLRALHFFDENERVASTQRAIENGDGKAVLDNITASGHSSWMLLQNIYASQEHQQLAVALALAERLLAGRGAWRVHGGGFAGTTLNIVPEACLAAFVKQMDAVFGENSCYVLDVRAEGACAVF